jgi:hypothetical protein
MPEIVEDGMLNPNSEQSEWGFGGAKALTEARFEKA